MNSERLPNHFVYRLIPPRPTFHLDMNEEEAGIMARHAEYWSGQMETGKVVAYGPVVDGTGSWGLAVFHADSEDEARGVLADDPAIATGMATFELGTMPVAILRATSEDPPRSMLGKEDPLEQRVG